MKYTIFVKALGESEFTQEKFLTGAASFITFAEAQNTKKALQKMSSSSKYKVVKF